MLFLPLHLAATRDRSVYNLHGHLNHLLSCSIAAVVVVDAALVFDVAGVVIVTHTKNSHIPVRVSPG